MSPDFLVGNTDSFQLAREASERTLSRLRANGLREGEDIQEAIIRLRANPEPLENTEKP